MFKHALSFFDFSMQLIASHLRIDIIFQIFDYDCRSDCQYFG